MDKIQRKWKRYLTHDDILLFACVQFMVSFLCSHVVELVIGNSVLPYNLTVMEALLVYCGNALEQAPNSFDSSNAVTPYSLWTGTHTI